MRRRATDYYPELRGRQVEVSLVSGGSRVLSSVYQFRVQSADFARDVIVKALGPDRQINGDRPNLKTVFDDQRLKFEREHAALSAIHEHFSSLRDPRFGTIRVLDFDHECCATVMERSSHPTLKKCLLRTNRIQNAIFRPDVLPAIENAGAWLRSFHSMDPLPESKPRNDTRQAFIETIDSFLGYLSGRRCDPSYSKDLFARISDLALATLPDSLPTAMGHGDFAPRNILVGPGARVSVIDTTGAWRPAIFEDIAFFIGSLRTTRLQAVTRGLALSKKTLAAQEAAFLRGYFGRERLPEARISLFVVQALLDKWCAHAERVHMREIQGSRFLDRVTDNSVDAQLRREIERRLESSLARADRG